MNDYFPVSAKAVVAEDAPQVFKVHCACDERLYGNYAGFKQ
jgi:hypothetical protein